ncbi:TadE/TadG family type IV pilus assembly protein [Sandaracinus amylolyticus]|uniref:TadE-like domain-containing protein n=1 Tax=Sandaracinus amylolyticus TaxID=927083 RepID=A0A0F6WAK8_9BACT|nr:TadE/TadG family type IV pilus assembly protein [Sandaracinus amylolyticus]AKF11656.1 hypothetical protein DB32_008805 [Sandaracinus amylolyticus]
MVGKLARDTRGAAYVEFLISFIPVFLMFLGMVQMGLMFVGGLAVQRAASAAARAAIVVLDDDPQYYGGEGRMQIGGGSGSGPSAGEGLIDFLGSSGVSGGDTGGMGGAGGSAADTGDSARLSAIHSAASIPLFAVAPPPSALVRPESVMAAIGNNRDPLGMPPSRLLSGLVWNNTGALAVRLVDGPASRTDQRSFDAAPLHEDDAVPTPARVRVTYLFHCGVPLANRLMCNDPLALLFGADGAALARLVTGGTPSLERLQAISRQRELELARESRDEIPWSDLGDNARQGVGALGIGASLLGMSMRVKVMTAEAQLPIQYANYQYQSE